MFAPWPYQPFAMWVLCVVRAAWSVRYHARVIGEKLEERWLVLNNHQLADFNLKWPSCGPGGSGCSCQARARRARPGGGGAGGCRARWQVGARWCHQGPGCQAGASIPSSAGPRWQEAGHHPLLAIDVPVVQLAAHGGPGPPGSCVRGWEPVGSSGKGSLLKRFSLKLLQRDCWDNGWH